MDMNLERKETATVISQEKLASDIYSMWLKTDEIAEAAEPGQFISLYCNEGSRLLPRPISICEIDKGSKALRIVYRVVGKGTDEFSRYNEGDAIPILGPLGKGFRMRAKKAMLIAGGIGIPPMLELAKQLANEKKCDVQIVTGYRSELFLTEELRKIGSVYIASEDGSVGTQGNVMDAIKANSLDAEVIYACGPLPMLKAVKEFALEHNIEAQISLEERMACGVGACLGCVCKTTEKDHHTNVNNQRICKEGPVFDAREVEL